MITEGEDDGLLIDLDLAVRLDRQEASGAPSKTGTKVFMAIGALLGEPHSFMHDLESFFWVLFWVCLHWDGPGKKRRIVKEFEDWNYLPTEKLASEKAGRISKRLYELVEEKFTSYCKPLIPCVRGLHDVIFPGGVPWSRENRGLYQEIEGILRKARKDSEVQTIVSY